MSARRGDSDSLTIHSSRFSGSRPRLRLDKDGIETRVGRIAWRQIRQVELAYYEKSQTVLFGTLPDTTPTSADTSVPWAYGPRVSDNCLKVEAWTGLVDV